jgi:FAD binding domain of DNA photolyase
LLAQDTTSRLSPCNRSRLIVGSFLTRTLRLDWRLGADVFSELIVDGDVASNVGNWQWVAGTGANPRPGRVLNPRRQAVRFDPDGDYVRGTFPSSPISLRPQFMRDTPDGFETLERRNSDRSLVSEQRVRVSDPVVPFTEEGARTLGRQYWQEVARASRGLVRCRETTDRVELKFLGRGPALLHFGGAQVAIADDVVSCSYRITGGLLSLDEAGTLVISQAGGSQPEIRVVVGAFFARLGSGALYGLQRRAHLVVSRRYFRQLLAGASR